MTRGLRTTLPHILGSAVAEEFIAVAEQQTGKPVSKMTATGIDTPRLQRELEAIEARQWTRTSSNSLGELRLKMNRSKNGCDKPATQPERHDQPI